MVYLTKDRKLDRNMFHSTEMKTHGIRLRVKATLDVYCNVFMKDMMEEETCKALELLFPAQNVLVNVRKPESDVRIREFTNSDATSFTTLCEDHLSFNNYWTHIQPWQVFFFAI